MGHLGIVEGECLRWSGCRGRRRGVSGDVVVQLLRHGSIDCPSYGGVDLRAATAAWS